MNFPLQVLHLEDDARDTELVQAALEGEGIQSELTRVEREQDFLAALKRESLDLILADYTLPSFDGLSALRIAQRHLPEVPFIFVSGTLGEDVAIEALKTGATDYVLKTRLARLGPAVTRALREAREKAERARAETALRRSEAFLAEGQRISHTGSWSWNVSSGKVSWSEEHFRIFGYDPQKTQPSYQLFLETVHPEDRSTIEQNLDRAVREKSGFDMEFRIALADGSIKHVQGVGRPVLGESGEVDHYTGTTVDISERKRGEALFAGEKRLLEMIATGVALEEILNALSLIIEEYRRGTLASVLLLRADGVHLDSVAGPSLPKGWRQEMEKLPIGPCAGSCGTAAYRGSPVIVSDIATDPLWEVPEHRAAALSHGLRASWSNPILSSEGKVLGTLCIYSRETRAPEAQDLGLMEKATYLARVAIERDRAEAALRTSQQKYRDLINASPDAVCVIDADSRYVLVNPAGTKLMGRPEHELIGRSIADSYIEEERHLLEQRIEKLKAEGSLRFERKFVRANGEVIPVEVSLSTLRGRYYQAIIRDISHRKRREALLAGENRVLEMVGKRQFVRRHTRSLMPAGGRTVTGSAGFHFGNGSEWQAIAARRGTESSESLQRRN